LVFRTGIVVVVDIMDDLRPEALRSLVAGVKADAFGAASVFVFKGDWVSRSMRDSPRCVWLTASVEL
jgi:hypothetical protein